MKQSKNLSAGTSPLLSLVTEETLYRRSVAFSYYRGFRGSEGEHTILSSEKVQRNRNIVKGDKRVSEIQVSAFAASWPLISLWNKIVTSDEDIEAEGVLR